MKKLFLLGLCLQLFLAGQAITVNVGTAGTLKSLLGTDITTQDLQLTGTINAVDFKTIRDEMPNLVSLDISAVTIASYSGTGGTVSMNRTYLANAIPQSAFEGASQITVISIPSTATSIEQDAFSGCSGLTSLDLPPALTTIETGAFLGCSGISAKLTIPATVTAIGANAFINCRKIPTLEFAANSQLTTLGDNSFSGCAGLKGTLTIPASVTTIGNSAFMNCTGITGLAFGTGSVLTTIGDKAFSECSSLSATLVLPDQLTTIGKNAFATCAALKDITIPASVTTLGDYAFMSCSGLIAVRALNPIPVVLTNNIFVDCNQNKCTLFAATVDYKTAAVWKNFKHIIVGKDFWLSVKSCTISKEKGSFATCYVTSNTLCTAKCDSTWLDVTPIGPIQDSYLLTFTANTTNTKSARSTIVTVSAPGVPDQTIDIRQSGLIVLAAPNLSLTTSKVYDKTTTAAVTVGAITGVRNGDDVQLLATATYDTEKVGVNKNITVHYSLSGTSAALYEAPADFVDQTGVITKRPLTITDPLALNKVYDTTTAATITGTLTNVVTGDDVSLVATNTGNFAQKTVGTSITVTPSLVLTGADASNYSLTQPSGLKAAITAYPLTVSGLTASNKTYNGTTLATITGTPTVTPLGSDVVSVTGTPIGNFDTKNAGPTKAVTVTGLTLTGADAANYSIVIPTLTADILKATLTVSGLVANNKVYDGTTTAPLGGTPTLNQIVGDVVTVQSVVATFGDKNVGTAKPVTAIVTVAGLDADNYTLVQQTGLFADITKATATVTGYAVNNKIYDGTTAATINGNALLNVIGSDDVQLSGTASASFVDKNVGTAKPVSVSGLTLTGADAGNYKLDLINAYTADITKAPLVYSGLLSHNKTYDGNTSASVTGTAVVNPFVGDVVSVTGALTANFADKNVGVAKPITVTGLTLTGADAGNYQITQQTLVADITKLTLTCTGLTASDKVYDATVYAEIKGIPSLTFLPGDNVSLNSVGGSFLDKNVGSNKPVNIIFALTGTDADNYDVQQQAGITATITKYDLAVNGLHADNKVYDGTDAATVSGNGTISALGSDVVTVSGTVNGHFNDKNVGQGKQVLISGIILGGADGGNYNPTAASSFTADITPATLVVKGLTVSDKTYDGNTTASISGTAFITPIGSDVVTLNGSVASVGFDTKTAGSSKSVSVTGFSISGADAANYVLAPVTLFANIAKLGVQVSGLSAVSKTYDGTKVATIQGTVTLPTLPGDVVVIGTPAGLFDDKNVGTGKNVTATVTISGADADNYQVLQQTGLSADITVATLPVTGLTAVNKVYDGNTTASLSGTPLISLFGTDNVTLGGTASANFDTKDIGQNKPVTVSGYSISGADATNYTLTQPAGLKANITKATLSITGVSAVSRVYDTTKNITITGVPVVTQFGTDVVTVTGTAQGTVADKNVGNAKPVTVTGLTISGTDAANYDITQPTGLTADITPATLTFTNVSAANKVYNASTAATVSATLNGVLPSDVVTLVATNTGTFASKNVGNGIAVTATLAVAGADIANYTFTQPTGLTANITAKSLTAAVSTVVTSKMYDGTATAAVTTAGAITGIEPADAATVSVQTTAAYNSAASGTGKTITVSYQLVGDTYHNYVAPTAYTISGASILDNVTLSSNPTINGVGCDGDFLDLNYTILTGSPTQYKIVCDTIARKAGMKNVDYTNLPAVSGSGMIQIAIPKGTADGKFNATLVLKNALNVETSYPFQFTINVSKDLVLTKFNDVVLVNNVSGRFTAYQWYKNGQPITGATEQFYYEPKGLVAGAIYSVKLTTKDGLTVYTCDRVIVAKQTAPKVDAYPSPVKTADQCTVSVKGMTTEELKGATMALYSSQGVCIYQTTKVDQLNHLSIAKAGVYVGVLTTVDGTKYQFKVVVE